MNGLHPASVPAKPKIKPEMMKMVANLSDFRHSGDVLSYIEESVSSLVGWVIPSTERTSSPLEEDAICLYSLACLSVNRK